ncbi:MAG TPA: AMP-binding protein, partial [Fodinibius sp.]|nr:AMP-binding protein [Fodinibius sp.]
MEYQPTTILKEVDKGLQHHNHKVLFATKREGKWIETGKEEFLTKVRQAALGLYELGVRPGDRVSLHSENSAEWMICDQAVLSIGAVNIPIFETQPGEQIQYILEDAQANIHIVSNDKLFSDTKPLIESIESLEGVIKIFGTENESVTSFEELLEKGARRHDEDPDLFDQLKAKVEPDDLATLIYTSGTTGDPKGVMLTHWNIASNLLASLERVPFEENAGDDLRMLSYLPLSHVFERMITYLYIRTGYPIYYIEKVEQIRDDFKHVNPFYLATVPRLLEKIHTGIKVKGQEMSGLKKQLYYWAINRAEKYDPEHPPTGFGALKHKIADKFVYSKIRKLFGDNLLGVVSGGAALSSNLFCFINALGIHCIQGYGLTETSPVLSVHDRNH